MAPLTNCQGCSPCWAFTALATKETPGSLPLPLCVSMSLSRFLGLRSITLLRVSLPPFTPTTGEQRQKVQQNSTTLRPTHRLHTAAGGRCKVPQGTTEPGRVTVSVWLCVWMCVGDKYMNVRMDSFLWVFQTQFDSVWKFLYRHVSCAACGEKQPLAVILERKRFSNNQVIIKSTLLEYARICTSNINTTWCK